ncbi:MAG: FGGY-family carbohydrate kinase [Treponemataceae bacterium]
MGKPAIIAMDIGTSSLRAVLFDGTGRIRHLSRRDNVPFFLDGGRVEQNPDSWLTLVPDAIRECAEAAKGLDGGMDIAALTFTAQRSSVIPVDADCAPLRPAFMWQDTRTEGICERMRPVQRKIYNTTGLRVTPVFSAVKMTWLRENESDVFAATSKMMGIQDFVMHHLTGSWVTDRSLASRTNLYNLRTGNWDEEMMELFGVSRSLLCDLIDPGAVAGVLTKNAAERLGLPQGLPVISAGGDQQCAALGLGLLGPGDVVVNTGTGSYVVAHSDIPATDPEMSVFCNVSAIPGSFILEAGTLTTGTVYRWFAETFYDAKKTFTELDAEALSSPPGANGVVLMPHFKGSGAPYWNPSARGFFYNLSLSTTRSDMARAVLEGIVTEMAENIDLIARLSGPVETIRVAGGLTKSDLFNSIQADAYERTVIRSTEAEATALGAWISAAVTVGLFSDYASAHKSASLYAEEQTYPPNGERSAIYRELKRKKAMLYEALDTGGVYTTR